MSAIRTPYTALKHAQRKLPGSKIVFDQGAQMHRLMLATGETLNPEQAAQRSGIKYVPYIWAEVNPGGAIYITNPARYETSARKLAQLVANAHAPCSENTPASEAKA